MKAFFIVPQISHYRETFYEKLVKANPQFEWLIIDGKKELKDAGHPTVGKRFNFPSKRFTESTKLIGPYTIKNYPGLTQYVKKEKPELLIMPTIVVNFIPLEQRCQYL